MKKGKIAKKEPLMTEMQPATYYWCSCGESSNQTFYKSQPNN